MAKRRTRTALRHLQAREERAAPQLMPHKSQRCAAYGPVAVLC